MVNKTTTGQNFVPLGSLYNIAQLLHFMSIMSQWCLGCVACSSVAGKLPIGKSMIAVICGGNFGVVGRINSLISGLCAMFTPIRTFL